MAYRKRPALVLPSVLLLFIATARASEPNPFPSGRVGIYGAPDRLLLQGCQTFKSDEVRDALLSDWEVQLSSAPSGLLDVYVGAIRRQLRFGYLAAGFADAQVSVGADEEHQTVVAAVIEGARYKYGSIHLAGNRAISSDEITRKLTRPDKSQPISLTKDAGGTHYGMDVTDQTEDADWETGAFADVSPTHVARLRKDVESAYADAGYFSADVQVATRTEGNQAALQITVASEGPRAQLGSVTIKGVKAGRSAEVMKFLDLQAGEPFGADRAHATALKLWECGRFKKHLMVVSPIDSANRISVKLELKEFPGLPALDKPLPAIDVALLKFREWILTRSAAGEDLVLKSTVDAQGNFVDVIYGLKGSAFRVHYAKPAATTQPATAPSFLAGQRAPGQNAIDIGAIVSSDRLGIYSLASGRKLVSMYKPTLGVSLVLKVFREMKNADETKLSFAFLLNVKPGADAPGIHVQLNLAPSIFVEWAHDPERHCEIREGILTIGGKNTSCRIDAASGRLIEGKLSDAIELSARSNALQEESDTLEKSHAGLNSFDEKQPIASTAAFIAEEVVRIGLAKDEGHSGRKRAADAMLKLLSPHVLEPLGGLSFGRTNRSDFYIPGDPSFMQSANPIGKMIVSLGVPACDVLFERGTWPWVLAREQLLIFAGRTENLGPELDRVMNSNKIGPLGKYLTSVLVSQFNTQGAAEAAGSGLHDLNVRAFDKDIAVLTQGDSASAEIIRRFCDVLRKLPKEDVDALTSELAPTYETIARHFVAALRSRPDETIDKALPDAMDDIWPDIIHAALQSALQSKVPAT